MIELKFLKDLPIKLTNENKRVLNVMGGDIYYDAAGNRYGYITFNNVGSSPIFALQLFIREYSIEGKFVRDNEYFDPYIYYPRGEFVINEPIPLDKDTEAIEVTVVKATLDSRNFINDKFVGFKKEDLVELYQRKAPVKSLAPVVPPHSKDQHQEAMMSMIILRVKSNTKKALFLQKKPSLKRRANSY